jgi:hypothetical protein
MPPCTKRGRDEPSGSAIVFISRPSGQRYAGVPDYGRVAPPPRQLMIMLLGGLRELIATTVEDGGDIGDITEVAVQATQAMLGPNSLPAPAR